MCFIPTGGVGGESEGGRGGGEEDGMWDDSGMETGQTLAGQRPGSRTPFSNHGGRPKSTMRGGAREHRKRGVNLEVGSYFNY